MKNNIPFSAQPLFHYCWIYNNISKTNYNKNNSCQIINNIYSKYYNNGCKKYIIKKIILKVIIVIKY
jgi:hypothetical protein